MAELDTTQHEFDPREEPLGEERAIVSRCTCGWEGGAYTGEEGYPEARAAYEQHLELSGAVTGEERTVPVEEPVLGEGGTPQEPTP